MKTAFATCAAVLALTCGSTAIAQTAPTISVTPYLALNRLASPNAAQQVANQNAALLAGQTSAGTPGSASFYQAQSNINTQDLFVTNFNSYKGSATPAAPFQNEYGTRAAFGLLIDGGSTMFSIASLALSITGTGSTGLDFVAAPGSFNYGGGYMGILYGADGKLGGGDDTFVTSGLNTQLVNGLVGRGTGIAYQVTCGTGSTDAGPCGAGNQSYLDAAIAAGPFPTTLTGTYSLGAITGSGTFNITAASVAAAAPEPATWAMMILGFGLAGLGLRRQVRRSEVKFDTKIKRISEGAVA